MQPLCGMRRGPLAETGLPKAGEAARGLQIGQEEGLPAGEAPISAGRQHPTKGKFRGVWDVESWKLSPKSPAPNEASRQRGHFPRSHGKPGLAL